MKKLDTLIRGNLGFICGVIFGIDLSDFSFEANQRSYILFMISTLTLIGFLFLKYFRGVKK